MVKLPSLSHTLSLFLYSTFFLSVPRAVMLLSYLLLLVLGVVLVVAGVWVIGEWLW